MAYFAEIDSNNVVLQVISISEADCGGDDFPESEPIGQDFIAACGIPGEWLQTSEEELYRGLYAGVGYTYDPVLDEFVAPPEEEIEE
jgi:hypothetical protein